MGFKNIFKRHCNNLQQSTRNIFNERIMDMYRLSNKFESIHVQMWHFCDPMWSCFHTNCIRKWRQTGKKTVMPSTNKIMSEKFYASTWFMALAFWFRHSSLVDYLAQVINAKNCPTTFYCIFQLVWVPMTTTQNIRVCFLSSWKHFFHKVPTFEFI